MDLYKLTILEAHNLLKKKEISALDLTNSVLNRIKELEPKIGAFISIVEEEAKKDAIEADKLIAKGQISYLTGIPIAIKDLICTKGIKTTCASKILSNFIPPYDAFVIKKLKEEKAVIIGKTNMDEFAMGSSNETSAMKKVHNPWDLERVPGGSSGGSAAAVASDMCICSLGSDTGGSIRQPAAFCSLVGLKPSYGRVSRFGLIAFASSLDQIGPITKTVEDSAILLSSIEGYDKNDSTSVKQDSTTNFYEKIKDCESLKGMTIGLPKEFFLKESMDSDVLNSMSLAIKTFEELGAKTIEVSLPHTKYAVASYYVIAPSEASSNLARYDGVKYGFRDDASNLKDMYKHTRTKGFGDEVIRRIIIGTYALSAGYYDAFYKKASQVRTLMIEDYKKAFETCDVILSPTTPSPAFKINEKTSSPLSMYFSDIFTIPANLAGIPALSIPASFSKSGLPIGIQISGRYFDEETILKFALAFQKASDFHKTKPKI